MAYITLHPAKQLDFQINRILTYGEAACNLQEVMNCAKDIEDIPSWNRIWRTMGEKATEEGQTLHAAYYYRLAEFFLKESPEKEEMYRKSIGNYHTVINLDKTITMHEVPYQNTTMKTFVFHANNPIGSLVVFGGYDSFIEEFYLAGKDLADSRYNVYLFEGPGQGETLRRGLTFEPHWEKPVCAVLDYFCLSDVSVVGISWGGYLALRAAAFEPRISRVVAYDVLYDGFDCMTSPIPDPLKLLVKMLFFLRAKWIINALLNRMKAGKILLDWAITHGEFITGTKTPYDFYCHLKKHTLRKTLDKVHCDVLLLAGEKDHYIPQNHFYKLIKGLKNTRSVKARMFTEKEGGAEHCQIGNHQLAIGEIIGWLSSFVN